MEFQSTRTAAPTRFVHRAAFYSSPDQLNELLLPMVRDALARDAPVALIASPVTGRRMREALGDPAGLIQLSPTPTELCGSGQAVTNRRARELREFTDWAGPVEVFAEHDPHWCGVHPSAWVEADAAANIALATLPITLNCLYPADLATATSPRVADGVRWNHPEVVAASGEVRVNPNARPPSEVLARCPVPTPPPLGPPDRELSFTPWQLIDLRALVTEASRTAGLAGDHAQDFVLAVNEVASNAVEHGRGRPRLSLWRRSDRVICEVHDTGSLDDPLPGLRPPHPHSPRGRGLWIARQLCELLHVWSDGVGTHVRLQVVRD